MKSTKLFVLIGVFVLIGIFICLLVSAIPFVKKSEITKNIVFDANKDAENFFNSWENSKLKEKTETINTKEKCGCSLNFIHVTVTNPNKKANIKAAKEQSKPAEVNNLGDNIKVYEYLDINKGNLLDKEIKKAVIEFEVSREWLKNKYQNKVSLYRYHNNVWNKLETTKTSEDSDFVYYKAETPGFSVFAIAYEAGNPAPLEVLPFGALTDIYSQNIEAVWTGSRNSYGIVWQQWDSVAGKWDIYFNEISENGVKKTSDVLISTSSAPYQSWMPSIAWDNVNNKFGIAWEEHNLNIADNYEIYFAVVDSADYSVTTPVILSENDGLKSLLPRIKWSGSSYGIVWLDAKNSDMPSATNIFFAEFDASGNKIGITKQITTTNRAQGFLSLAWNSVNSKYAVAWENNLGSENYEIFVSMFNSDGSSIVEKRITNEIGRSQYPSIIWNNNLNEYGVAWDDDRDGNSEIYFTRVDASGNKIVSDIRVTNNLEHSQYPSIDWTGTEYGIAWMQGHAYFTSIKPGNMTFTITQLTDTSSISWQPKIFWWTFRHIIFYYDSVASDSFQKVRYLIFNADGSPFSCVGEGGVFVLEDGSVDADSKICCPGLTELPWWTSGGDFCGTIINYIYECTSNCGDGICESGENPCLCPADCGVIPNPPKGNFCSGGEYTICIASETRCYEHKSYCDISKGQMYTEVIVYPGYHCDHSPLINWPAHDNCFP